MTRPDERVRHWFVAPPLDGPITGGTLYNRELILALQAEGASVGHLGIDGAKDALRAGKAGIYWLDTLHLAELSELSELASPAQELGLIAHYLPSLVRRESEPSLDDLEPTERFALARARFFLAPSWFMASVLERLGAKRTLVVEPGRLARGLAGAPSAEPCLQATLVANLVPGKGVEAFLAELALELREDDDFELRIIGSPTLDPDTAARCTGLISGDFRLSRAVSCLGSLPPDAVVRALAESHLLVSASRMESFGMVLAEARTLGIPIVARAGGNVERLVDREAGGELVRDDRALAAACLALAREPEALRRRSAQARARCLPARPWAAAAQDFIRQIRELPSIPDLA